MVDSIFKQGYDYKGPNYKVCFVVCLHSRDEFRRLRGCTVPQVHKRVVKHKLGLCGICRLRTC